MVAYIGGRMRRGASEHAKGVADRRGGRGKCVENRKKILNSGNEPKKLLKTQELTFSGSKNELVFEGKRTQNRAKKWPRTHLLRGIEPRKGEAIEHRKHQGSGEREVRAGGSAGHPGREFLLRNGAGIGRLS
jgi:hypothetical protein